MMKRCFSAVLCAVMLLLCVQPAFATDYVMRVDTMYIDNAKYDGGFTRRLPSGRSYYGVGSFNFYNQLNSVQKAVYNAVKEMEPGETEVVVEFESYAGTSSEFFDEVAGGVFSVFKDRPEFFWLTGSYGANLSYADNGSNFINIKLTLIFTTNPVYSNPAATKAALEAAVESFDVPYGTRYDMFKYIHDTLCGMVTYSPCIGNPSVYGHGANSLCGYCVMAHEATGPLLYYSSQTVRYAVCEGYAEAFKLICDKYSIPCTLVISDDHMWNVVLMEDGKWYAIDATWDDQGSIIYDDFFLSGGTTVPTHFTRVPFNESHVSSGDFTGNGLVSFTYPTLSNTAFEKPSGFYTARGSADYSALVLTLPSVHKAYFNGSEITFGATSAGTGTGSKFVASTGTGGRDQEWSLVITGDADGDGDVTAEDTNVIAGVCVGKSYSFFNDVFAQAADVDNSGKIDALDAMLTEIVAHNVSTF